MKNSTKKLLSLLLTAAMVISMIAATACTVGAAEIDPKTIDKVLIDFRNEAAFTKSGAEVYNHKPTASEPDPLTGGKYNWNADEAAMQLEYHVAQQQKPYHIMFKVPAAAKTRLTPDYKYIAIVYKVVTGETFSIRLSNTPNQGKAIEAASLKGSDSYQILKGDISVADANGKSIQSRWLSGNINTVAFSLTGKDAKVFIKEAAFFKTEADLEAYYASVDITKDPSEYMSETEKAKLNAPAEAQPADPAPTPAAPAPSVTQNPVVNIPLEQQTKPVIWKITDLEGQNETGWKFTDHQDNTEGEYTFVTVNGEKALKLKYSPYGSFANYRFMPSSRTSGQISKNLQYIRITYMTTDKIASMITMLNNKTNSDKVVLVENTSASDGKWVRSNAIYFGAGEMPARLNNGIHCTFGFTSNNDSSEIYIKEIGFFASPEQAYAYYGDSEDYGNSSYVEMSFAGNDAKGGVSKGQDWGESTVNAEKGTLDIIYSPKTNHGVNYMAKIRFIKNGLITPYHTYMRILYSADHPEGVSEAVMRLRNDKTGEAMMIEPNLVDTNGEFVLSDTVTLVPDSVARFAGSAPYSNANHNSLHITANKEGGVYSILGVYFFTSKSAADSFTPPLGSNHKITISGNDISLYSIVISKDKPFKLLMAAETLNKRIAELTGFTLPVVTDDTAESPYEILLGRSARSESNDALKAFNDTQNAFARYTCCVMGSKLVVTSALPYATDEAVKFINGSFLYEGVAVVPETIVIDESCKFSGKSLTLGTYTNWAEIKNVENPEVFTEDFDTDDGYFTEDNAADFFKIENGVLKVDAVESASTYVHVYEANVKLAADLAVNTSAADSDFGVMLRYTGKDAFVKAGYDFAKGEWYITSREGSDFYTQYLASAAAELVPGTVYRIEFTVDGSNGTLAVNGQQLLTAEGITHITPGRFGFYADNTSVSVDNVSAVLLSGQGTVMKNVFHTLLPDDEYREGGSVFEMNDGSLNYTHHYGINFKSLDGGRSWERTEPWTSYTGYVNMLRLVDGKFMKISSEGGWMYSYISEDEGKTWTRGGAITRTPFNGDTKIAATAVNMNDKLNQAADGTILYGQNYETTVSDFEGKKVFCQFFFSKDNGATWQKSDTDSWTIPGNEKETHFGECKLIVCADGTVRMYNSWNKYGCVVYSDSTDGGKTFGPIVTMPEFPCGRSSMQFFRDPYGETDTTYYMIWVNTQDNPLQDAMPRSSLTLAKTTDGKNWVVIGDIWRWQSNYRYGTGGALLNHVVDPFIKTTADYIIVGTGLSEHTAMHGDNSYHGAQRQHIWAILKDTLPEGVPAK